MAAPDWGGLFLVMRYELRVPREPVGGDLQSVGGDLQSPTTEFADFKSAIHRRRIANPPERKFVIINARNLDFVILLATFVHTPS